MARKKLTWTADVPRCYLSVAKFRRVSWGGGIEGGGARQITHRCIRNVPKANSRGHASSFLRYVFVGHMRERKHDTTFVRKRWRVHGVQFAPETMYPNLPTSACRALTPTAD